MIEMVIIFLIFALENCVIVYLFMKERQQLIRYLAEKSGVDTKRLEDDGVKVYDSIALDEELEAEIEKKKKKKLIDEIMEGEL